MVTAPLHGPLGSAKSGGPASLSDICPKGPHGGPALGGRDRFQEGADYSHLEAPHKRRFGPATAQTLFCNFWQETGENRRFLQQGRGVFSRSAVIGFEAPDRAKQRLSHQKWPFSRRKH